jgi:threonine aldolase
MIERTAMSPIRYDFRSDTVTRPSPAMRAAIAAAEVGDDVFGDDPTVQRLEAKAAQMLGKEAALYLPSGTQSNLVALMAHCYRWEAGGAAVLGSIQPQPLSNQADGTLRLADIAEAIKPDDSHFAITRLLALENTIGGKVLSLAYMAEATALARRHNLACHLDGARAFNAGVALGVPIATVVEPFDTVSLCMSKGLGAPIGSLLTGSRDAIATARRLRKMLGGGLRQVGVLAAAAIYALEHNVDRLALDHARARRLAEGLSNWPGLSVTMPDTNIVFVDVAPDIANAFVRHLEEHGVGITAGYGSPRQRWVTHLDVDDDDVDASLAVVRDFFRRH